MSRKIKTSATKKLRNRFRFVVLNDETFEEKLSLTLTKRNVWVLLSVSAVTLVLLTAAVIVYTPLKYFIPGFGDYNYRSQMIQLQFKTDSIQSIMNARAQWLDNVVDVVTGKIDTSKPVAKNIPVPDKANLKIGEASETENELRRQVEEEDNYSLAYNGTKGNVIVEEVKQMHPIIPVEGYVTDEFDAQKEHFGLDIAAKSDAPVKAILDGKIISASFTIETGYVIELQHSNNLVSIYKHNARLMKKAGDKVKAGEVIALAGNTGENSTGTHLHLELWHDGKSLNPRDYIVF